MEGNIPVRFVLSKRTFYITLSFPSSSSFRLAIWDGKTLWEGIKFGDSLMDLVPEGMTNDAYFDILKEAFKVQDTEGRRFTYAIARHPVVKTDASFKWTIKTNVEAGDDEDDVAIPIDLCGELHLAAVPEDRAKKMVQEMMDLVLHNRNELDSDCTSLKMLNEILKAQRYDAINLLSRLEQEKRAAEVEQFSKFVLVLNAKKAKIAELRQLLNRQQAQVASLSQNARMSQAHHAGTHESRPASLTFDPMLSPSLDPLDPHFDTHEVYSLSTPRLSKRKSDLILEGNIKAVVAATKSPSKPQNLFDMNTPSSLASASSSLKQRVAQSSSSPQTKRQTRPTATSSLSGKRSRLDDILAFDDSDNDDDQFPLPEPKRWKH